MASFPPVNSVVRALDLLEALNRRPISTVDDLYGQTGIPKPSIVRLLQTLERRGLVRHAKQHGAYFLTSQVRTLSSGYHSEPRLIEASAGLLDDLTRKIKWPLAIAVPDSGAMIVRYSTIPLSPLSLLHSSLGMRLSLVSRALGRAYLAFCDPQEQEALIALLRKSQEPEDALARDEMALRGILKQTYARGLATRDPRVRAVSNTLAVPVYEQSRVVASVGLTFFSSAMEPDEAIRQFRGELTALSTNISKRLDALMDRTSSEAWERPSWPASA
jgi:IclR family transcriptional regulator, mhp operon transcriptional activator